MRLSPRLTQKIAWAFAWAAAIFAAGVLLFIVIYVLARGAPEITPEFLLTPPKGGLSAEGGISSAIVSTLYLIVITMLILTPLGIGAAIYLAEYAPENFLTRLIRYNIGLLAGVPSIIFGLFGFALFVLALHFHYSILSGALTLSCLLLPFLARASEESIKAVPQSHREAALSLGATKWQMITKVVLPEAMPGIVTGIILCVGGVVAESACLYVTMGGATEMPLSPLHGGRSLAVHLFYQAFELAAFDKALATGAVLIAIILLLNFITRWIARRLYVKIGRT